MLVLSRKSEETIVINEGEVRIKVLSVKNGQVKFGIDAPRDMTIDRLEIHNKKLREGSSSAIKRREGAAY